MIGRGSALSGFAPIPNGYVNNVCTAEFLQQVLRDLRGPVIVLWDRGNMHRGEPIRDLLRRFPHLQLEWLSPYAPELNPGEKLWYHL